MSIIKRATLTLSGQDLVMRNHQVHGKGLVPGIVLVEAFWRFISTSAEFKSVKLKSVVFENPIALDLDSELEICLELFSSGNGCFKALISSRIDAEELGGKFTTRTHMSAFVSAIFDSSRKGTPWGGSELEASPMFFKEMSSVYQQARAEDIIHQRPMKAKGVLEFFGEAIRGRIALEDQITKDDGFYFHPGIFDASTLIAFAQTSLSERPYIPISIEEIELLRPLETESCFVWVPKKEETSSNGDIIYNDYSIFDENGDVVVKVKRICCKRIRYRELISDSEVRSGKKVSRHSCTSSQIFDIGEQDKYVALKAHLAELIGRRIGVVGGDLLPDAGFYELGLDSVSLLQLADEIAKIFHVDIYPTLLFEFNTLESLTSQLCLDTKLEFPTFDSAYGANTNLSGLPDRIACLGEPRIYRSTWRPIDFFDFERDVNNKLSLVVTSDYLGSLPELLASLGWDITFYEAVPAAPTSDTSWAIVCDEVRPDLVDDYQRLIRYLGRAKTRECSTLLLSLSDVTSPLLEGLGAYCLGVNAEFSGLACSVLQVIGPESTRIVSKCIDRILCGRVSGFFLFRNGCFQARWFEQLDRDLATNLPAKHGNYLVTGGSGRLAESVASFVASELQGNVHLVGRSTLDERLESLIASLNNSTTAVTYSRCDITVAYDCRRVVRDLRDRFGDIDGVFHLAGVLEDRAFVNGDREFTRRLIEPKLLGAETLFSTILDAQSIPLEFFVSFSSISAVLPNPGQSDYAFSNAALESWTSLQNSAYRDVRFLSVSWPFWEDVEASQVYANSHSNLQMEDVDAFDDSINIDQGLLMLRFCLAWPEGEHFAVTRRDPNSFASFSKKEWSVASELEHSFSDVQPPAMPIAVVGVAGEFPGAESVDKFWEVIASGRDMIKKLGESELRADASPASSRFCTFRGASVKNKYEFAPSMFNISRREAEQMDPQERRFLMIVWTLFQNAGYPPEKISATERVGVFCGVMWNHYQQYRDQDGIAPTALHSSIPNRVSYCFNLTGPSMAVDSACSSSLLAVHQAINSLRSGECTMAVAGGVNLTTHSQKYHQLMSNGFLSETGRCSAFGEDADGYVPGEGVGAVLLKPLSNAFRDGDFIHAVLRGSSANHNGRSSGFTVPTQESQAAVVSSAILDSAVDTCKIGYFEAHGTGTSLGDPIEIEALTRVTRSEKFGENDPIYVGSVKTNIGHLESAAGIAGLIKVILQLQKGQIAPTLHCADINRMVLEVIGDSCITFPQELVAWPRSRPLAGISSFGAGGTNVHVVAEGAPDSADSQLYLCRDLVFPFSADSQEGLLEYASIVLDWLRLDAAKLQTSWPEFEQIFSSYFGISEVIFDDETTFGDLDIDIPQLCEFIKAHPEGYQEQRANDTKIAGVINGEYGFLNRVAYTLQSARSHFGCRLAVIACNLDELENGLDGFIRGIVDNGLYLSNVSRSDSRKFDETHYLKKAADTWCSGLELEEQVFDRPSRISIPVPQISTDQFRLGSWASSRSKIKGKDTSSSLELNSLQRAGFQIFDSGVALLTLSSPSGPILITEDLLAKVEDALEEVNRNKRIKVLVITGDDDVFCLGGPLSSILEVARQESTFREASVVFEGIRKCIKPVITAMAGSAAGGGFSFGLYGDIVVASLEATYSANFIGYGLTPGLGASYIMPVRLGRSLASEMLLTGRDYRGEELRARGASIVFARSSDVLTQAVAIGEDIARHSNQLVCKLKKHLCCTEWSSYSDVILAELALHSNLSVGGSVKSVDSGVESVGGVQQDSQVSDGGNVEVDVRQLLSDILFAELADIGVNSVFGDLGLDSVGAVQLVSGINERFGTDFDSSVVYEFPTVARLAGVISDRLGGSRFVDDAVAADSNLSVGGSVKSVDSGVESVGGVQQDSQNMLGSTCLVDEDSSDQDDQDDFEDDNLIAVVSMSGRWPGADNLEDFAATLSRGECQISEPPGDRWDFKRFIEAERADNRNYSKKAAFLADIDKFDYKFFELSPLDVESMDYQQRVFLTEARNALSSSQLLSAKQHRRWGIYVGCAAGDHLEALRSKNMGDSAQAFLGTATSILAARVAYFFDLDGPSVAVDTACSSSLVALHLACQALRSGEIDAGIAGGVAVMETPSLQIRAARLGILSPTGTCAPFQEHADGIVLGEGVGVVVLMRLKDAVREGKSILAVIRGSGVNGDGRSNGIVAPNPHAQARLISSVLATSGVKPESIELIEAHGTGTKLGDPMEVKALLRSFGSYSNAWLSSVKANVGHTTTAAGICGFIKAVLCLNKNMIPPMPNLSKINSEIRDFGSFRIAKKLEEWPANPGSTRYATVSSFSFSGTNCFVLLQDHLPYPDLDGERSKLKMVYEDFKGDKEGSVPIAPYDPIVAGHIVGGIRLLPAAGIVEIVRRWRHSIYLASDRFELSDVRWKFPLAVDKQTILNIRKIASEVGRSGASEIVVESEGVDAVFATMSSIAEPLESQEDEVNDYLSSCTTQVDVERLYSEYWDAGLQYGDQFKRLGRILVGDNCAIGFFEDRGAPGGAGIETALIDSGFQLAGALISMSEKRLLVPAAATSIKVFLAIAEAKFVLARKTEQERFDIKMINDDYRVVAIITGLRLFPLGGEVEERMNMTSLEVDKYGKVNKVLAVPQWVEYGNYSFRGSAECRTLILGENDDRYLISFLLSKLRGENRFLSFDDMHLLSGDVLEVQRIVIVPDQLDDMEELAEKLLEIRNAFISFRSLNPDYQVSVYLVTCAGVSIDGVSPVDPLAAGLLGIVGALAAENEKWGIWGIDLKQGAPVEDLNLLVKLFESDILNLPSCRRLAIRAGRVYKQIFCPKSINSNVDVNILPKKLIVVGGAGTVGQALTASFPTSTGVWIGRRRYDEVRFAIEKLRSEGIAISYLRADISNPYECNHALRRAEELLGGVDIVFHCAGELRDSVLVKARKKDIVEVISPRMLGVKNIFEFEFEAEPDVVVASSAVSFVDSPGQASYAAACCTLDAMVHNATISGRRAVSVNWGYWSGGVGSSNYYRELMLRNGIHPLSGDDATMFLYKMISDGGSQYLAINATSFGLSHFGLDGFDLGHPLIQSNHPHSSTVQALGGFQNEGDECLSQCLPGPADSRHVWTRNYVREIFCEVLGFDKNDLALDSTFDKFGVDSVVGVQLIDRLARDLGRVSDIVLFEHNTIRDLADYICQSYGDVIDFMRLNLSGSVDVERKAVAIADSGPIKTLEEESKNSRDIAVIGVCGKYPGADTLEELWINLQSGRCLLDHVPASRWRWQEHPELGETVQSYQLFGGFINDPYDFDAGLFNILPETARGMDPQERLVLECVWRLLEQCGYLGDSQDRSRVGVFAGVMYGGYGEIGARLDQLGEPNSAHSAYWSIANRVSYSFNLGGPSISIDTACSSSLSAVHLAVRSLRNGECEAAIVCGSNLILHPSHLIDLGKRNMLASDGKVKVFDASADGYVPGEGIGALLLKRAEQAYQSGDVVWSIIKGSAMNSGGKTSGYTVPSPAAQSAVVGEALQDAGVPPETITYVEAHGSGTSLGDPIEVSALAQALGFRGYDNNCWIGSIKSNIGHLEGAAGVAGLTKAILQLRHRTLTPTANLVTPNPSIDFVGTGILPVRNNVSWSTNGEVPLRCGVSSFGAGGTNVHIVLQEPPTLNFDYVSSTYPKVILLSAPDRKRLAEYADEVLQFVKGIDVDDIPKVAWVSQTGRPSLSHRIAMTFVNKGDIECLLEAWLSSKNDEVLQSYDVRLYYAHPGTYDLSLENAIVGYETTERLLSLAYSWTRGVSVDWCRLWEQSPGMISFPGVPMKKVYLAVRELPDLVRSVGSKMTVLDEGDYSSKHGVVRFECPVWESQPLEIDSTDSKRSVSYICLGNDSALVRATELKLAKQGKTLLKIEALSSHLAIVAIICLDISGTNSHEALIDLIRRLKSKIVSTDDLSLIVAWRGLDNPAGIGLAAFVRVLREELRCEASSVGLGGDDLEAAASLLAGEALQQGSNEVRYLGSGFETREIALMKTKTIDRLKRFRVRAGNYVISGGAGQLAMLTAKWLLGIGAERIWLLGRSDSKAKVMDFLSEWKTQVEYLKVDVSDETQVAEALALIRRNGPVNGVVHAAGVLRDGLLQHKRMEEFEDVLSPKVRGFLNLDKFTAHDDIDFFISYSSVVSRVPNKGQSDYSYANAYMEGLSIARDGKVNEGGRHGVSLSIGWSYWEEGGMRLEPSVLDSLYNQWGMLPLPSSIAFDALESAMMSDEPVIHVIYDDNSKKASTSHVHKPGSEEPSVRMSRNNVQDLNVTNKEFIKAELRDLAAEYLNVSKEEVDFEIELLNIGFDSISLTDFISKIGRKIGIEVHPSVAFDNPTLKELSEALAELSWEEVGSSEASLTTAEYSYLRRQSPSSLIADDVPPNRDYEQSDSIAIVGIAAKVAGADTVDELWDGVLAGRDFVVSWPDARMALGLDEELKSFHGGFLNDVSSFDPEFFGISPKEATTMDPQHRIFLEVCWQAIWNAGIDPTSLAGSSTGVFVGVSTMDYQELVTRSKVSNVAHMATGNSHAILANRISHILDVHGPSESIDAACASSLVAVHRAVQSLRSGECDQALVGGVNVILTSGLYASFTDAGMMSAKRRCAAFDETADGYVRSEGAAVLYLKPLKQALIDSDHVYATIEGSSVNHCGRTASLTAPSSDAQAKVILEANEQAGTLVGDMSYIEAHGTGTKLGDPIEIEAIKRCCVSSGQDNHVYLGTIKSFVGHLESAAGVVGLINAVNILRYRKVPKQLHFRNLNPLIDLSGSPLAIATKQFELPVEGKLLAGISSFGFGGVNAHVVISNFEQSRVVETEMRDDFGKLLVPISGMSIERIASYSSTLKRSLPKSLPNFVFTMQRRHRLGKVRRLIECTRHEELIDALDGLANNRESEWLICGDTEDSIAVPAKRWLRGEAVDLQRELQITGTPKVEQLPTPPFHSSHYWYDSLSFSSETSSVSKDRSSNPVNQAKIYAGSEFGQTELESLVCEVLGIEYANLSAEKSLKDMGVDSILAIELSDLIFANTGIEVRPSLILECSSLGVLMSELENQINAKKDFLNADQLRFKFQLELVALVEHVTGLRDMSAESNFDALAISSIHRLNIVGFLEAHFGQLSKTLLYDYKCVADLAGYFISIFPKEFRDFALDELIDRETRTEHRSRIPIPEGIRDRTYLEAELRQYPQVERIVSELVGEFGLEDSFATRRIAPYIYLPDHRRWCLSFAYREQKILVWRYAGPPDQRDAALADFYQHFADTETAAIFLWPTEIDAVAGEVFSSTPFGVIQDISIQGFTLEGPRFRRLRNVKSRFDKIDCTVCEYILGSDLATDRKIFDLARSWVASKNSVSNYVFEAIAELEQGAQPKATRIFVTLVNGDIVLAVVLSALGAESGYLLDLEFYDEGMPSGCLEYTIIEISSALKTENIDTFSLGATFGIVAGESCQSDPRLLDELAQIQNTSLSQEGNYRFKRKFRPEESLVYACYPSHLTVRLAEIMQVISLGSEIDHIYPHSNTDDGIVSLNDTEIVLDRGLSSEDFICGFNRTVWPNDIDNIFELSGSAIKLDLMSDSLAYHISPFLQENMARLVSEANDSRATLPHFPFQSILSYRSGRAAEEAFCKHWPLSRGRVLHNGAFPTWISSLAANRFNPIPIDHGPSLVGSFARALSLYNEVSFVLLELCPNSAGGTRIALSEVQAISKMCRSSNIPLVVDATRSIDNFTFPNSNFREFLAEFKSMMSASDVVTMSLSKNFGIYFGGLVATNRDDIASALADQSKPLDDMSAMEMRLIYKALENLEPLFDAVIDRQNSVGKVQDFFNSSGIATYPDKPTFCLLFDLGTRSNFSLLEQCSSIFKDTGARMAPHLYSPSYPGLENCVRLAFPVGFSSQEVSETFLLMGALAKFDNGAGFFSSDELTHNVEPRMGDISSKRLSTASSDSGCDVSQESWFVQQLDDLRDKFSSLDRGEGSDLSNFSNFDSNFFVLQNLCPQVRRHFIRTDKDIIEFFEAGGSELPPLVLIHPFSIGAGVFGDLFALFSTSRRVIAIHQPGVGESRTQSSLSLDGQCDSVMKVLGELGCNGRFHVAGASVGSIFAQHVALRFPDKVSSLILLGGSYKFSNRKGRIDKLDQVIDDDFLSIERGGGVLSPAVRHAARRLLLECESMDPRTGLLYLDMFAEGTGLAGDLSKLRAPTLIVQGSYDSVVGVQTGRFLHNLLPDSIYREFDNSGHFALLTEPEAVKLAMSEFIRTND